MTFASCRKWSLRHNSSSLGQRKRRVVAVGLCWDLHDGWTRIHLLEHESFESFLCSKRGFPGHGSIPLFPLGISTGRWTCMYLYCHHTYMYIINIYIHIISYRYVTHLSAIYYYIVDCSIVRNWHESKDRKFQIGENHTGMNLCCFWLSEKDVSGRRRCTQIKSGHCSKLWTRRLERDDGMTLLAQHSAYVGINIQSDMLIMGHHFPKALCPRYLRMKGNTDIRQMHYGRFFLPDFVDHSRSKECLPMQRFLLNGFVVIVIACPLVTFHHGWDDQIMSKVTTPLPR